MTTPAKSFDDLRSILGKLDRKIDNARSKRLGLDDEPEHTPKGPENGAADTEDAKDDADEVDTPAGRSPFGRAKPLNRNGPGNSGGTWIGGAGVG